MALPNKTRGEFRPIYEALFNGKDYRALTADAKLCLLTLKGLCGPLGIKEWPALVEVLAERCSIPPARARQAVEQLQQPTSDGTPWIAYEDGIVWVVRGLAFEPSLSATNPHHGKFVQRSLVAFPNAAIVARFRARYGGFFGEPVPSALAPEPARDGDRLSDRHSDSLSDSHSHSLSHSHSHRLYGSTTPAPAPSPSPAPPAAVAAGGELPAAAAAAGEDGQTAGEPHADAELVDASNPRHGEQLRDAVNSGLDQRFGEISPTSSHGRRILIGGAARLLQQLTDDRVPLAFALGAAYERAASPSLSTPPRSLAYFASGIAEDWQRECARRGAAGYQRPASATGGDASSPAQSPRLRQMAVLYASQGSPTWVAWCEQHGIAFARATAAESTTAEASV